jgi:hypothetical protein
VNYKYIGLVLLAVWLITQGLENLFEFYFPHEDKILPAINLIAGIILLLYAIKLKHGDIGLFLLGCWAFLSSSFFYSNIITHVLGVAAGIMLIMRL